jgi:ABC-type amino acid transport substrate-binding protein
MRERHAHHTLASLGMALVLLGGNAFAGPHDFVVQLAHVGGDRTTAQDRINQFLRYAEQALKWRASSASGEFNTKESDAEAYIAQHKPGYGIFDPDVFFALHKKYDLQPIATLRLDARYQIDHLTVLARDPKIKTLADLKGKTIVSNHLGNPRYLSRVAFAKANLDFQKDFKLTQKLSTTAGLKELRDGSADATVVDDVQLASKGQYETNGAFHIVEKSPQLPLVPVVSFGKQPDAAEFAKMVLGLCAKRSDLCKEMQVEKFVPLDKAGYDDAVKRYEK